MMHAKAFEFVRKTAWALPPLLRVAEFGSREVNGSVREIFTDAQEYVGIDIASGKGVDVVADAAMWGKSNHYDAVICCEVMEHCDEAETICWNAARILRPGGVFVTTMAGEGRELHGVDGGMLSKGEFYCAVTPALLRRWLRPFGFSLVDGFSDTQDVYALGVKIP